MYRYMDSGKQQDEYGYDAPGEAAMPNTSEFDAEKARRGARLLLEAVGRDPEAGALTETWNRRIPEMLATLTEGRRPEARPTMRTFDAETDGLVVKTGIPLHSTCEHHLLPFSGVAHVAYRPGDEMVGLSKLVRYVKWRARRLTTQEELTRALATGLADELDARGVIVEMTARHMCEMMRGVETETATTTRERVGSVTDVDRDQFRDAVRRHGESGTRSV